MAAHFSPYMHSSCGWAPAASAQRGGVRVTSSEDVEPALTSVTPVTTPHSSVPLSSDRSDGAASYVCAVPRLGWPLLDLAMSWEERWSRQGVAEVDCGRDVQRRPRPFAVCQICYKPVDLGSYQRGPFLGSATSAVMWLRTFGRAHIFTRTSAVPLPLR